MGQYATEPVCRVLEIPNMISSIGYEISTLEGLIKDLKERLLPIRSCKDNPLNVPVITEDIIAPSSSLANTLYVFNGQISFLNTVVRTIHDELEL